MSDILIDLKKVIAILLISGLSYHSVEAQDTDNASDKVEFFTIVEDMPEYKGGDKALLKWVQENTNYPKKAQKKKIEGTVYVSYMVEPDSSISNVKVARGVHELLDKEAVRVISAIKGYEPGRQRGKPVRVQYTIPVKFYLDKEKEK